VIGNRSLLAYLLVAHHQLAQSGKKAPNEIQTLERAILGL
jgi:hypothetical protein